MYAGLFFAADTVCGETNVVKDVSFTLKGKKGTGENTKSN